MTPSVSAPRPPRTAERLDATLDFVVGRVRVVAEGPCARAVARVVAAMGFARAATDAHAPTLRFASADGLPTDRPPEEDLRILSHDQARGYRADGGWRLWTPSARSRVTPAGGHADVGPGAHVSEVGWHLATALHLLLRGRGAHGLHAAAVEAPAGGVLLVGPSDAGKSTLAYALARHGWPFVSDDSVLLHVRGDAVEAVAFRRRFGLDADGRFPEIEAHAMPQPTAPGKWSVDVTSLCAGQGRAATVPRLVVLPRVADAAESRVEPVRPAEAFGEVLSQIGTWRLDDAEAEVQFGLLARLLAQAPAVRLATGRDVFSAPERVAARLTVALTAR